MARKSNSRAAQGSGTIRKKTVTRNGQEYEYWEARVTIGRDPGSGKQIQKSFSGKTQKEVREKMQAAAVAVNDGDFFQPSKMTFGEWLDIWLRDYQSDKKYLTTKHYEAQIRTHVKPALGAIKLQALTAPQIQRFYNDLLKSGQQVPKKDKNGKTVKKNGKTVYESAPMAPKSVRNIHGVVIKALNVAVDVGYIRSNPAERVTLPRVEKTEIKPLTDAQVVDFLKAVQSDKYAAILQTILFTGMRESEAIGLTWDTVDFKAGTIKVCKQLQKRSIKDGGTVFAPLKNDKARTITAAPSVMRILEEQRKRQIQ